MSGGWRQNLPVTVDPSGNVQFPRAVISALGKTAIPGYGSQMLAQNANQAFTGQYTFLNGIPCAATRYSAVKIRMRNPTASDATWGPVKVASAPATGNNGTALTWSSVTWSGASTVVAPAAVGSALGQTPWSDTVFIASVPRTDNPAKTPLLHVRGVLTTSSLPTMTAAVLGALNTSLGMDYGSSASPGDLVSTISAQIPTVAVTNYPVFEVMFISDDPMISLLDVGDSRAAGSKTTSNYYGLATATMKNSLGMRVKIGGANYGVGGQGSANSFLVFSSAIATSDAHYATIWTETPNDGDTAATYVAAKLKALEKIRLCRKYNTIPIIITPTPRNMAGANLTAWQTAVTWARTLASTFRFPMLDLAKLYEDPVHPGQWNTLYHDESDTANQHANEAGQELAGLTLATLLNELNAGPSA